MAEHYVFIRCEINLDEIVGNKIFWNAELGKYIVFTEKLCKIIGVLYSRSKILVA